MHLSRRAPRASLGGGACGSAVRTGCKYAAKGAKVQRCKGAKIGKPTNTRTIINKVRDGKQKKCRK